MVKTLSIKNLEAFVKKCLYVFIFFSLFLWFAGSLEAQEFTGRVSDSTGSVLNKATVTAHHLETNLDFTTITTTSGSYTIPYLKPGSYSVSVKAAGFETSVHTGIVLEVGQTSTVNFNLNVGRASETITVVGDTLVNFSKADLGEVVENTRVTELPLNGRDAGMLSILNAGALWTGTMNYQRPFDDTQANLSVNGGGSGNVALLLDGVSNTASSINNTGSASIAYVPPVDSVQEFKIITNPYDAQYGLMAGGVEDVTLKSGTNKLHGDVYEYARRTWLDANTWSNDYFIKKATPGSDVSAYKNPPMKWDQYGVEVDGPISLPKIYDGRNKTFFTMQYEYFKETEPNTITISVPDPAWADGDFTSLGYNSQGKFHPISILDPENIAQNASGAWVRVPFGPNDTLNPSSAANIIPKSRINAMAQQIIKLYPSPNTNTSGSANPFANNYTSTGPDTNRYRNALMKLDHNLSAKDRLSLHYGYWERVEVRSYDGFTGPERRGQLPHGERAHNFTVEETHTFTPNLLFDFRANASVRADYTYNGPSYNPTALGWSASQVAQMGSEAASEFPRLDISEFQGMGTNSNSQTISNSLSLNPTATWIKKQHSIHAGLDARFMQSSKDVVDGGNYFWIDRQWTQTKCGSCGSWDEDSGNSIATLLLGNPSSGRDDINVETFWSAHYWAPFIQDDWKVSKKLTLNLGARWDFVPAEVERNNHADYAFDTKSVNPINDQVSVSGYSQILGGVRYAGINGNPRGGYALTKWNIQPRVGFAYALNDKTVIRGGIGESMKTPQNAPSSYGYSSSTSYQASDPSRPGSTHPNTANPISNPYDTVVQPSGSSLGMKEMLGQGPWFLNPKYKIPNFWNYSFGFERQFLQHDTVSVSYIGTRLYNGDTSDNINRHSSAAMATCNPQTGGRPEICDNNNLANPFKGISGFEGSGYYSASTINTLDLTRPFPEFTDITEYQQNDGRTWYNSLQVTALHKWSKSLTLHGTWNWSKLMDANGWRDQTYRVAKREIDVNDHTHRVTLSGVYLLPVGRGRTLLPNTNQIVDKVVGGWELGSMYIFQSGGPWLMPDNPNKNYLKSAHVKPHTQKDNGYLRLASPCSERYQEDNSTGVYSLHEVTESYYDYDGNCSGGANFQEVPSYGVYKNNVYTGVRLPSSHQFDANLSKNFEIVAGFRLQVRLEAFNVLNHPQWTSKDNVDGSSNDVDFGAIQKGPTGQNNVPRQMQLSTKIVW
jgi:hypothetical protein